MKKKTLILVAFVSVLAIFLIYIMVPHSYEVRQAQPLPGMRTWNLSTGSRIAYIHIPARGDRKPFPVIFLQGGPGGFISGKTIASLAPLAGDGFDVYLYDQVGSGHSSRLSDISEYTVDRHLRDLEEIVRETGAEKVILIGQSWGAMLGAHFTAGHAGQVERLVLTGPGPLLPVRNELKKVHAPDSLHLRQPLFSNGQAMKKTYTLRWMFIHWWARTFGQRLVSDREADGFLTLLNNELNKSVVCDTSKAQHAEGGGGYFAQVMTVNSFPGVKDPRQVLRKCDVPLLLMRGQCDGQPWGYAAEYLQLFQNHRLVIVPQAGHSISVEQPERYISIIREFLSAF